MDEYDNIRQMPNREPEPAGRLNLHALSILDDHGHLTVTFWLLAAVVVVGIYLVIEMLSEDEVVISSPVPDVAQAGQNHNAPSPTPRRKPVEKATSSDA